MAYILVGVAIGLWIGWNTARPEWLAELQNNIKEQFRQNRDDN
jgi:hypothetical protein